MRSFAEELRGMFYRCPRCRDGVIAVGEEAAARLLAPPPGSSGELKSPLREAEKTAPAREPVPSIAEGPARDPTADPTEMKPLADDGKTPARKTGKARRLLVECELCGYNVPIPAELYGKTVRCPECRGDIAFTESTLEPVKEEILGRIALDGFERTLLERPVPRPILMPALVAQERRKRILVIVVVIAVTIIAAAVHAIFRPHVPGLDPATKSGEK